MSPLVKYFVVALFLFCSAVTSLAAPFGKIETPPLSERWLGIYVNNERVGFYRQKFNKTPDGFRIDGNGSVRMKVMSFSKEASISENYSVSKGLALRSFDIEQTVNGTSSHVSGKVSGGAIQIKNEVNGKITNKVLKFRGEVYPGPALNLYPVMRAVSVGTIYKIQLFDPEELKIKNIQVTVLGEDKTSEGGRAIKLRNNLYPFVNNDVWVDGEGNTVEESVREGLVITKSEPANVLGHFVSDWALAKQDLIYDFSLVRVEPPLKDPKNLKGLAVEISDWNDALQLLQDGGQVVEKRATGRVVFKTGSLAGKPLKSDVIAPTEAQMKPADKIESDAPEIIAQAKLLAEGTKSKHELAKTLASWTTGWLKDTVNDGGGAISSYKLKSGNCQTHARLYTALARASGIPTRFVSGLVHMEGKGFLYHSWAESFIDGEWVSVDPTYNQLPADPTHLKLLEGHRPEDMAPIIAIIGRIRMTVLKADY